MKNRTKLLGGGGYNDAKIDSITSQNNRECYQNMREYRQNLQKEHFADKMQNCKTNPEIARLSQKSATDFSQESYSANSSKKCYKTKSNFHSKCIYFLVCILTFAITFSSMYARDTANVTNAGSGVYGGHRYSLYVYLNGQTLSSFSASLKDVKSTGKFVDSESCYVWGWDSSTLGDGNLIMPEAPSGYRWAIAKYDGSYDNGTVFEDKTLNSVIDWMQDSGSPLPFPCYYQNLILVKYVPQNTQLAITGSVECDNSMMLLTIVKNDNNAVVQEIGFVTGQTNVTMSGIALETNTTYKVLVTKPFGSVIEVVGATQTSPTVYTFSTGSNATLALTFTLSGNGRWSNTVVV